MLAMSVLSPVMLIGNHMSERKHGRKSHATRMAEYREHKARINRDARARWTRSGSPGARTARTRAPRSPSPPARGAGCGSAAAPIPTTCCCGWGPPTCRPRSS